MFTQECYIRRNNTRIINKLIDMGYVYPNPIHGTALCATGSCTILDLFLTPEDVLSKRLIDCGTNEDLFLAIAALRDDTDKDQWFVNDEGIFVFNKNEAFDIGMANYINYFHTHWHKATVEELIEHFKDETIREIHFYYDCKSIPQVKVVHTYKVTKCLIEEGNQIIHTTSLANLSFDLLDFGYRIFLHQNFKVIEAKPGMESDLGGEVCRGHDILKMWLKGDFENYFKL